MAGIYPDVPRNVHGDSRHSGSCDVAAEYPGSFVDIAGRDELDPDVLSARRDHRHPSKWLDHPGADVALVVCDRDLRFHARLCRVRLQWQFRSTRALPGSSGLRRRHAHPGGLFGRIPAFPHSSASGCDHDRGVMAVLAPTVGPVVGGWISETWSWQWLFLINVAPGI